MEAESHIGEVEPEHIRNMAYTCYQCGVCSGGCPVAAIEESFRPREIMQKTLNRKFDELTKGDVIWLCAACYNCYEQCPQEVKVTDVIFELQSEAIREGIKPEKLIKVMGAVYRDGLTTKAVGFVVKQREKAGLKAPPEANVEAAKLIIEKTGLSKLIKGGDGK
jgi:heterodisulfide reductase subunit C